MFREDIILDIKESTSIILDLLRSQDLLREGTNIYTWLYHLLHLKIEHWYLSYRYPILAEILAGNQFHTFKFIKKISYFNFSYLAFPPW